MARTPRCGKMWSGQASRARRDERSLRGQNEVCSCCQQAARRQHAACHNIALRVLDVQPRCTQEGEREGALEREQQEQDDGWRQTVCKHALAGSRDFSPQSRTSSRVGRDRRRPCTGSRLPHTTQAPHAARSSQLPHAPDLSASGGSVPPRSHEDDKLRYTEAPVWPTSPRVRAARATHVIVA